jgi:hypothetical protein
MLYTITLYVCMITSPDGGRTYPPCKEVPIQIDVSTVEGFASLPHFCQKVGMLEAARWKQENPLWNIMGWKCPPRHVDKPKEENI